MPRIAVIPGDGIGVEVMREAVKVLGRVVELHDLPIELREWDLGAERYLREGVTITEDEIQTLGGDYDAILLGALGDPRVPSNAQARDILLGLRFQLDLYVNFRPCVLLSPTLCPLRNVPESGISLEIFRENTEGPYVNVGGVFKKGTPHEVAIQEDLNTYPGVERIVRAAFDYAKEHSRSHVTLVDKANALPHAGGLWRRVFREVGEEFPGIERDTMFVDAMAMDLVRRPERWSVLVTSNLFGDILSDLSAILTGGLGLAPSANLHPGKHALFEPVHGSAPDIAGTSQANPVAAIRCTALLLGYLGYSEAARDVEAAAAASIVEGEMTPDLGGGRTTGGVGDWISDALSRPRIRSSVPEDPPETSTGGR